MNIDIKKSTKLVNYTKAIDFLEKRLIEVNQNKSNELIWILEHPSTFTAGMNYDKSEILDKRINLIKTNRGGKITWHGPGQLICYFVIDLNKRKKDIRKFVTLIEKTIMQTLKKYKINSFTDRKNIGIWVNNKNKIKKIGAIGIKIKKWIAYHGFSLNELVINKASLLAILLVTTFIYSLLNSKLTFLSFIFFIKVIKFLIN